MGYTNDRARRHGLAAVSGWTLDAHAWV